MGINQAVDGFELQHDAGERLQQTIVQVAGDANPFIPHRLAGGAAHGHRVIERALDEQRDDVGHHQRVIPKLFRLCNENPSLHKFSPDRRGDYILKAGRFEEMPGDSLVIVIKGALGQRGIDKRKIRFGLGFAPGKSVLRQRGYDQPRLLALFPRQHGVRGFEDRATCLQRLTHDHSMVEGETARPVAQPLSDVFNPHPLEW